MYKRQNDSLKQKQKTLSFFSIRVFEKYIFIILCLSLLTWPSYISIGYVSVLLPVCLSLWGYILHLWQRSFPLSSNWPAPFSPCLLDNWTCSPNPRIPISGSLQPLCILHTSYLSVISLWTSLWPLDQREYTILPCPNTSQLFFTRSKYQRSMWDGLLCSVYFIQHLPPLPEPLKPKSNISLYSIWRTR